MTTISVFILGAEPVPAGKPGKQKKRPVYPTNGSLIDDWHMCVKNLNVSSRENQALKLVEGHSGYWQSAGSQGKVLKSYKTGILFVGHRQTA